MAARHKQWIGQDRTPPEFITYNQNFNYTLFVCFPPTREIYSILIYIFIDSTSRYSTVVVFDEKKIELVHPSLVRTLGAVVVSLPLPLHMPMGSGPLLFSLDVHTSYMKSGTGVTTCAVACTPPFDVGQNSKPSGVNMMHPFQGMSHQERR